MLCVYIHFTCDCFPDSYCHGCSRHCKATFPTFSCKFGTGGALFGSSIGSSSASPMAEDRIARRKLEEEKEKEHIAVEEEPGRMLWPWDVQHLVLFLRREHNFFLKITVSIGTHVLCIFHVICRKRCRSPSKSNTEQIHSTPTPTSAAVVLPLRISTFRWTTCLRWDGWMGDIQDPWLGKPFHA